MINYIALLLFIAIGILLNSISVSIVLFLFYITGIILINIFSDIENRHCYFKIFSITFLIYAVFALFCRLYMDIHNFKYLFFGDTIEAYLPGAIHFMKQNDPIKMFQEIFASERYSHIGIISMYFAYVGKFASIFDQELYYNLQTSIFFLSSFVCVFVCKLLKENDIKNSTIATFVYAFGSILAFYATGILRDSPMYLTYVIVFCYALKDPKIRNIFIILVCILLTFFLRDQYAIFLAIYGLTIFLNKGNYVKYFIPFLLAGIIFLIISIRLDFVDIFEVTMRKSQERLAVGAAESTLNSIDELPWGISHITKVLFVHLSPMPCWSFINLEWNATQVRNLMCAPRAWAVLYNFLILGIIIYGLVSRVFKANMKMTFILLLTFIFLVLQSDSTEQRRIAACYPILLLYASSILQILDKAKKKQVIEYSIIFFLLFQIAGIFKFI